MSTQTVARLLVLLLVGLSAGCQACPVCSGRATEDRLFEMRTYTTHPGKLEALNARFRNHTNRLFVKHGMGLVGYWTPVEGPGSQDTLVYLLAYPDRAARDASWKAFRADPVWKKAHAESTQDGKIVKKVESRFLNPTDYSDIR